MKPDRRKVLLKKNNENLFITLGCFCMLNAGAQLTKPEHKAILFSGETITGTRLVYESPILKDAYFSMDDEVYESTSISCFQNNHGYFANLCRLHGLKAERYALRIKTGKMNLFEEVDMTVYGGDDLRTEETGNNQDPMLATGKMYEYYNKGDEPVRKATYSNLIVDLGDNELSVAHLHRHRNYRLLQWGMIGVGAGIVTANILAQSHSAVRFNPIMAMGIIIGGGSYCLQAPKEDELWLAADEYNMPEDVLSER